MTKRLLLCLLAGSIALELGCFLDAGLTRDKATEILSLKVTSEPTITSTFDLPPGPHMFGVPPDLLHLQADGYVAREERNVLVAGLFYQKGTYFHLTEKGRAGVTNAESNFGGNTFQVTIGRKKLNQVTGLSQEGAVAKVTYMWSYEILGPQTFARQKLGGNPEAFREASVTMRRYDDGWRIE